MLHGALSAVLQDEEGQILEAHSISAGLDYPGSGPELAHLRDIGRVRFVAVTDDQAVRAFRETCRLEGIIPALECAHAIAWLFAEGAARRVARLRPAHALGPRRQGPRRGARARRVTTGVERIAAAFSGHGRAAALMPYLMGGYPDIAASIECGLAAADAGADLIELGVPFSDPLADGPVIHAAGTEALRNGVHVHDVLGVAREISSQVPVVLMVYANPVLTRGPERFAAEAAAAGAAGLIVPDLPFDEAGAVRGRMRRGGHRARPARRPDDHARAARRDRPRTRAASSTPSRSPARPASATSSPPELGTRSRASARPPTSRSRSGSASRRPSTRAASARSPTE